MRGGTNKKTRENKKKRKAREIFQQKILGFVLEGFIEKNRGFYKDMRASGCEIGEAFMGNWQKQSEWGKRNERRDDSFFDYYRSVSDAFPALGKKAGSEGDGTLRTR
ncbi:MAG: hypothetical protein SO016_00570 [Lachnospiraceae bacterium]|nr:hypothetical protein [Lachnospiraceae bacterium]